MIKLERFYQLPQDESVALAPHEQIMKGYLTYLFESGILAKIRNLPTECPQGEAEGIYFPLLHVANLIHKDVERKKLASGVRPDPLANFLYTKAHHLSMLLSTLSGFEGRTVTQAILQQKATIISGIADYDIEPDKKGAPKTGTSVTVEMLAAMLSGSASWDSLSQHPSAPLDYSSVSAAINNFNPTADLIRYGGQGALGRERLSDLISATPLGLVHEISRGITTPESEDDPSIYTLTALFQAYLTMTAPESYETYFPRKPVRDAFATVSILEAAIHQYIAVCYLASQIRMVTTIAFGSLYIANIIKLVGQWIPTEDRRFSDIKDHFSIIQNVLNTPPFKFILDPVSAYVASVENMFGKPLVAAAFFDDLLTKQDWQTMLMDVGSKSSTLRTKMIKTADLESFYLKCKSAQGPLDATIVTSQRLRTMDVPAVDGWLTRLLLSTRKIAEHAAVLSSRTNFFRASLDLSPIGSSSFQPYFSTGSNEIRALEHEKSFGVLDIPHYMYDIQTASYRPPVLTFGLQTFNKGDLAKQEYASRMTKRFPYLYFRRDAGTRLPFTPNPSLSVSVVPCNFFLQHTQNITPNEGASVLALLGKFRFHGAGLRSGFRAMLDVLLASSSTDDFLTRMIATQLMSIGWLYYHGTPSGKTVPIPGSDAFKTYGSVGESRSGIIPPLASLFYGVPIRDEDIRYLDAQGLKVAGKSYFNVENEAWEKKGDSRARAVITINPQFSIILHSKVPVITRALPAVSILSDTHEIVTGISVDVLDSPDAQLYEDIYGWTEFATAFPYLYWALEFPLELTYWKGITLGVYGDSLLLSRDGEPHLWSPKDLTDMTSLIDSAVLSEIRPLTDEMPSIKDLVNRFPQVSLIPPQAAAGGAPDRESPGSGAASPNPPSPQPPKPTSGSAATEGRPSGRSKDKTAEREERKRKADESARMKPTGGIDTELTGDPSKMDKVVDIVNKESEDNGTRSAPPNKAGSTETSESNPPADEPPPSTKDDGGDTE